MVLPVNIQCQVEIFPPNTNGHKMIAKGYPTMTMTNMPKPSIISHHWIMTSLKAITHYLIVLNKSAMYKFQSRYECEMNSLVPGVLQK